MDFGSVERGRKRHGERLALRVTDPEEPHAVLGFAPCPQCTAMTNCDPGFSPTCRKCGLRFPRRRQAHVERPVQWVSEDAVDGHTPLSEPEPEEIEGPAPATKHVEDAWICTECGAITPVSVIACRTCTRPRGNRE